LNREELARAIDEYTEAIRLDPQCGQAYLFRARIHEELGEDALAEADLAKAGELGES
jgi:Tfp pilus assembly protein PilF